MTLQYEGPHVRRGIYWGYRQLWGESVSNGVAQPHFLKWGAIQIQKFACYLHKLQCFSYMQRQSAA